MNLENGKDSEEISFGKKGRGPAKLKDVMQITNQEERLKIIYNDQGQPIGEHKKKLAGYMGLLVKSYVPITYKTWHKVPDSLKNDLWVAIQVKFDVDRNTKKSSLSSMSTYWRAFKTNLTRDCINKLKDKPELLKDPPLKYKKFIDRSTWAEFVKDRLSENFKNISKEQRERRAKNIYNHRMSKKGYAGLAEELKEELGPEYQDDRSFLWTKGREKKGGGFGDDATKEIVDKVVTLKKEVEDGSVVIEGTSDILSMALGTSEHSGRVRGLGFGVTPSTFFNLPRRASRKYIIDLESRLKEERQRRIEAEQKFSQLQNQLLNVHSAENVASNTLKIDNINCLNSLMGVRSTSGSTSESYGSKRLKIDGKAKTHEDASPLVSSIGKAHEDVSPLVSSIGKEKRCRLAIGTKNNIVAMGMVFVKSGPHEKIHNVSLGEQNVRVSITKPISPNVALPIPVGDEMTQIKDAIGSIVAWPKELVLIGLEEENNDDAGVQKESEKNDGSEFELVNTFSQMLTTMKTDQIRIPIDKEMFGDDTTECYIFKQDLADLCTMKPLGVTCIKVYMRFLYMKFEKSQRNVQFFNSESFNSASHQGKRQLIKKRLKNATRNQVCFIPYNIQSKFHWVLIVIDLSTMVCYWLDPKSIAKPSKQIKLHVNIALTSLHIDEKRMPKPVWRIPKCPQQEGGVQCEYFLMKFMRELIGDPSLSLEIKMKRLGDKETYTLDDVNEVRNEFKEYVVEHIPE